MGEFMLGSGVVTAVPFTGGKGRPGVAEKRVYNIISNCTSALCSHRWSLTEEINIQASCAPAQYLNKIFKRTQLHLLTSDIFYLFASLDLLIPDSVTKSSSLRCYRSNISAEPFSQNILKGILSQTNFTL